MVFYLCGGLMVACRVVTKGIKAGCNYLTRTIISRYSVAEYIGCTRANSKLRSKEAAKELSGRYAAFTIHLVWKIFVLTVFAV